MALDVYACAHELLQASNAIVNLRDRLRPVAVVGLILGPFAVLQAQVTRVVANLVEQVQFLCDLLVVVEICFALIVALAKNLKEMAVRELEQLHK